MSHTHIITLHGIFFALTIFSLVHLTSSLLLSTVLLPLPVSLSLAQKHPQFLLQFHSAYLHHSWPCMTPMQIPHSIHLLYLLIRNLHLIVTCCLCHSHHFSLPSSSFYDPIGQCIIHCAALLLPSLPPVPYHLQTSCSKCTPMVPVKSLTFFTNSLFVSFI